MVPKFPLTHQSFLELPLKQIRFKNVKEVQALQGFLQDHLQEI